MTLIAFSLKTGEYATSDDTTSYEDLLERAHGGEEFLTVDVSHWTPDDLAEFDEAPSGDQLARLEGLLEGQGSPRATSPRDRVDGWVNAVLRADPEELDGLAMDAILATSDLDGGAISDAECLAAIAEIVAAWASRSASGEPR